MTVCRYCIDIEHMTECRYCVASVGVAMISGGQHPAAARVLYPRSVPRPPAADTPAPAAVVT